MTACFIASAIRTAFSAPAMPVFISTASAPSSIAIAASDAMPTPASRIRGTPVIISRRMRILAGFCTPSRIAPGSVRQDEVFGAADVVKQRLFRAVGQMGAGHRDRRDFRPRGFVGAGHLLKVLVLSGSYNQPRAKFPSRNAQCIVFH